MADIIVARYTDACRQYGVETDAGVLVALRYGRSKLRVSPLFGDKGMLPLADVLLELKPALKVLDFSQATITSHGAIALSKILESSEIALEEIRLQHNKIGAHGARAVADSLAEHKTVKFVNLRGCWVGERGAFMLCRRLLNKVTAVEFIDLSLNSMGIGGMGAINDAITQRKTKKDLSPITVDLHGNAVAEEVMNAVTHGLGFVLCIVGTVFMGLKTIERGATEPGGLAPVNHRWCVSIYCISLCVLYISSTLYHSFFALTTTREIFAIFDQAAIYILITGSYTPILGITFADKPMWSVWMLSFLWACCLGGIYIEAFMSDEQPPNGSTGHRCGHHHSQHHYSMKDSEDEDEDEQEEDEQANDGQRAISKLVDVRTRWKANLSLGMYLGMGWASVLVMPDLAATLDANAVYLFIAGGLFYTGGVPFFVRDRGMDHALWHMFVLGGSICHYFAIYYYIIPMP
jgi:hemolysin III